MGPSNSPMMSDCHHVVPRFSHQWFAVLRMIAPFQAWAGPQLAPRKWGWSRPTHLILRELR